MILTIMSMIQMMMRIITMMSMIQMIMTMITIIILFQQQFSYLANPTVIICLLIRLIVHVQFIFSFLPPRIPFSRYHGKEKQLNSLSASYSCYHCYHLSILLYDGDMTLGKTNIFSCYHGYSSLYTEVVY